MAAKKKEGLKLDYKESVEYINNVQKYGSVLGLESIKELLRRIGNPQDKLKIVHFAGTNGKGSTITFTESVLIKAGYKVGKYTSPAVFNKLEVFQINGNNILEKQWAEYVTRVADASEKMASEGMAHPTPFEIETAMAFLFFYEMDCDIVLLETGMGGLTDATNVMNKVLCSVLTSIGLDHTAVLGDTVEKITEVKAGIIKEGCPAVISSQGENIINVVENVCKKNNSKLIVANKPDNVHMDRDGYLTFDYMSENESIKNIKICMPGGYQPGNAATAIEVLSVLQDSGYEVKEYIKEGLKSAKIAGRFERICDSPVIIIDGAHNPPAALELAKTLQMYFTNERITFIMGMLADKNYRKVAGTVLPLGRSVVTITPDNPRRLEAKKLADCAKQFCDDVTVANDLREALEVSLEKINNNRADIIVAFGSLSYLGRFKELTEEMI